MEFVITLTVIACAIFGGMIAGSMRFRLGSLVGPTGLVVAEFTKI